MQEHKKINVLFHDLGSVNFALIREFKKSPLINNIYLISKNNFEDLDCIYLGSGKEIKLGELKELINKNKINFAVIFNEIYSAEGFTDYYRNNIKIPVIGVTRKWFWLETNKIYGKKFMLENNIKTPEYMITENTDQVKNAVDKFNLPLVIKNNNLQAGFGSHICTTEKECKNTADKIIKQYKFCIAEKYIKGKEISQTYLWDENTLLPLLPVKDYKKLKEHDKGINTGGLGCYTPVNLDNRENELLNTYNKNLSEIFKRIKPDFTGIFTVNLLLRENDIYTLEFNMRPGITEFETLIEHIDSDLLNLFYDCAGGNLINHQIKYKNGITGCVVLAHKNYAKQKEKRKNILLTKPVSLIDNDIKLNFNIAGTNKFNQMITSTNKRFLSVLCTDKENPFKKIYKFINGIKSKNIYYRKDIGENYEK